MITHKVQFGYIGDNVTLIIWRKNFNTLLVIHTSFMSYDTENPWYESVHNCVGQTLRVKEKYKRSGHDKNGERKTIPGIGEYFQIGNGGVYRAEKNNFLFIVNLIAPSLSWLGAWSFLLSLKITNQNSISCLSKPQNYLNTMSLQK